MRQVPCPFRDGGGTLQRLRRYILWRRRNATVWAMDLGFRAAYKWFTYMHIVRVTISRARPCGRTARICREHATAWPNPCVLRRREE